MNKQERIKKIEIENKIWLIYILIIVISYYANYLEKEYFETNNIKKKEKYRKLNAFVFIILIVIYSYFENDAISEFFKTNKNKQKEKYDTLILIGTTAVLISGLIFLYIILEDNELLEEIAFN